MLWEEVKRRCEHTCVITFQRALFQVSSCFLGPNYCSSIAIPLALLRASFPFESDTHLMEMSDWVFSKLANRQSTLRKQCMAVKTQESVVVPVPGNDGCIVVGFQPLHKPNDISVGLYKYGDSISPIH